LRAGTDAHVQIAYHHAATILLSLSLRFRGPAQPILDRCRAEALATVHIAAGWRDQSLVFASNTVVTSIAYAATLLLRVGRGTLFFDCVPRRRD
jgi:hypothetical protein